MLALDGVGAGTPVRSNPWSPSTDTDLYLSAASAWEIAIKHAIGKLRLPEPPAEYVPRRMESMRVAALSIDHGHTLSVAGLPPHHRDPFDRMLIAQAIAEQLVLVTSDPVFGSYDVTTFPA